MTVRSADRRNRDWYALAGLLLLAALQYIWNAFTVTPLVGYDAVPHAAYVLTIVEDGRLPQPLEGWSTFPPPLYYLLGAGLWKLLEPLGAQWIVAGLRALSALGMLAAGGVAFDPVGTGTSTVSASIPGYITQPNGTVTVIVN